MSHTAAQKMLKSISATKLERPLLSDQAAELLRKHIISGQILPGTKLVEREVAQLLDISRAPARDALLRLEEEGLVVTKPDARYVIELNKRDIHELYLVRLALEKLAAELAAQNNTATNQALLNEVLLSMEKATEERDHNAFGEYDIEMHRLIWKQADNHHLLRSLNGMMGPILMFVMNTEQRADWSKTLQSSRELIAHINAGEGDKAARVMEKHILIGLDRAMSVLETSNTAASPSLRDQQ